jgi:hypothetical protein
LGGRAVGPDLLPGSPLTPLVSCGVALGPGEVVPDCVWVGPDLLPGKPGFPAPLFCAKAADRSKIVESAAAAIVFVRMGYLMGFPPPPITGGGRRLNV